MAGGEKITFENAEGQHLAARLDRPSRRPRAFALFAHCFTCSKDVFAASRISQGLAERGFAVLRFDFTGLGASEGEFANTSFSSNVEDLVAAADWLRQEHAAPAILIGHSLGGAAVLAAAGRVPEAKAVATIAAPFEPAHAGRLFTAVRPEIEAKGEAEVQLAGRTFTVKKQFLDDLEQHRSEQRIRDLDRALLIFHSPIDDTVGIDNAGRIFGAARHPKSFVSLDDADHLLTRRADSAYVAEVLAAWASRYLPKEAVASDDLTPEDNEVVVAESGEGRFAQVVRAGRHELLTDEPAKFGGNDSGPGPYAYLLAGLGACTSMTVRMYAERKGVPLEGVAVRLRHQRIHAKDCEDCESPDGRLEEIEREITLAGNLDDGVRARLLEIADKCPVHRTLSEKVRIRTKLAE